MISFAVLTVSLLSGCNLNYVRGNGQIVTEKRPVTGEFHEISIESGIDGDVKIGPPSITVESDSNVVPHILTRVHDGKLEVRTEEGSALHSTGEMRVHVTTPSFDRLEVSGGGHVVAEAGKATKLTLDASGGAGLDVTGVAAEEIQLDSSGGSEVTLKGSAKSVKADVSGGGALNAAEFPVQQLALDASGGASVEAQVKDQLSGELSGGSSLKLTGGRPALKGFEVSGGSEISSD